MPEVLHTAKLLVPSLPLHDDWMKVACAFWSSRLADLLNSVMVQEGDLQHPSVVFLQNYAQQELRHITSISSEDLELLINNPPAESAIGRIAKAYKWGDIDLALFIIAGLAEIHEGYADVLKTVNPENRPFAATGLAAQMVCQQGDRKDFEYALIAGPAVTCGAITIVGDGPLFSRNMRVADGFWSVLNGIDVWPPHLPQKAVRVAPWGLSSWLRERQCQIAVQQLSRDANTIVRVRSASIDTAINRALSLAQASGRLAKVFSITEKTQAPILRQISLYCCACNILPILVIEAQAIEAPKPIELLTLPLGSVIIASRHQDSIEHGGKPLLAIKIDRLTSPSYLQVWSKALPNFNGDMNGLAARFPVEPEVAAEIANDLSHLEEVTLAEVGSQIRARANGLANAGIILVTPTVGWDDLILPPEHTQQLNDSIERLENQSIVLNQWGFLKQRRGATGVRVLLAGAPGTGKTLAAEVLASEIGVDLLIVDISRIVSKWIGETEKNLEAAFEAAEQSKAVLLFDEADALFSKRTEVNDANDRNANLETAYLLTRLEQFEGLVVMSTNLRNNIDPAFLRRLEFIIDFNEPDRIERRAIWECHVPTQAPLASDVDFGELAAMFPVVGGVIKNAAVSAAFSAAAQRREICKNDFVNALRREYEKQGKAFPVVKPFNQGSLL